MSTRCVKGVVEGLKSSGFVDSRFWRFYILEISYSGSSPGSLGCSGAHIDDVVPFNIGIKLSQQSRSSLSPWLSKTILI